jgi:PAS domain S-box-containing protein
VRWSEADAAGERWRALSDAAQDTAILTTDTDGDVRSFSAGASRLFGWDEHEVLARPAALIFDESSYKDLLPKLARRSLRTQGITTRSRLLRRDGESFPAEVSVRMLSAPGGQPMGFMMVVRDVTEQTRLEGDLRESEERFRGLVEGLAAAVFIVRGGRVVYANPAAGLACGRAAQELEGTLWRERVAGRDVLIVEELLAGVERKQVVRDELRCGLIGRGGDALDARIVISSVEFGGRPAALLLVHDETVDNRAAAELQDNEAKLDAVLEAASDGILVLTAERDGGVVQMVNHAFAELVGMNVDVLLGIGAERLLAMMRATGGGMALIAEEITSGESGERDVTVQPRPDASHEVRVRTSELCGRNGELLGRLIVCRDLTEQRRSERRLQEQAEKLQLGKVQLEQAYLNLSEANEQLQTRTEELDRVNRELRRLDEMKSDLLGNVSHELQTPLVSIRGYTEMMLKERLGPITEEQRKGLGLSLKNIDRLISMIDNLLAFERTDPVEARLSLTRFKLRPLIQEAVDLLRAKMTAKEIDLAIEMQDEDVQIHGDRDRLLEVFLNLLSNAVKFNRPKGAVRITTRAGSSGYSAVTVRDTGVGIPPESVGRIFDRHYRVQQEGAAAADGSGLGLAIVRDILRLHGCTIEVESEEGSGAAFTFTLPLSIVPAGVPEIEEPPLPAEAQPSDPAEPPRLRIIRRFKTEG